MTRTDPPLAPVRRAFVLLGRATRLPEKFLLAVDGEPIVRREVRLLTEAGLEVTVVSVLPRDLGGVSVVADPFDAGPLGGLEVALSRADGPFFLFGGDMPFLDVAGIRTMHAEFDGRALVPVGPGGEWEVLHAIYAGVDARRVEALRREGRGLKDLVAELDRAGGVRFLPAGAIEPSSFRDVDTAEEYRRLARDPALGPTGRRSSDFGGG